MTEAHSPAALQGYTVSVRTLRGRLIAHIEKAALLRLGAANDDSALLLTLEQHLPRLHALALQLAARGAHGVVTVRAEDVWWAEAHARPAAACAVGNATGRGRPLRQDLRQQG